MGNSWRQTKNAVILGSLAVSSLGLVMVTGQYATKQAENYAPTIEKVALVYWCAVLCGTLISWFLGLRILKTAFSMDKRISNEYAVVGLLGATALCSPLVLLDGVSPMNAKVYQKQAAVLIDYMEKPQIEVVSGAKVIRFNGKFATGSADRFNFVLSRNPMVNTVELDSVGGKATEGYQVASTIRAKRLNTKVVGECSSACTFAFLAGKSRDVGMGKIGVHMTNHKITLKDHVEKEKAAFVHHYERYGVSKPMIEKIMQVPASEIWYVPNEILAVEGWITRPAPASQAH